MNRFQTEVSTVVDCFDRVSTFFKNVPGLVDLYSTKFIVSNIPPIDPRFQQHPFDETTYTSPRKKFNYFFVFLLHPESFRPLAGELEKNPPYHQRLFEKPLQDTPPPRTCGLLATRGQHRMS